MKSLDKNIDGEIFNDERFKTFGEEEEHFIRQAVGGVAERHYQTHIFELKGETQVSLEVQLRIKALYKKYRVLFQ